VFVQSVDADATRMVAFHPLLDAPLARIGMVVARQRLMARVTCSPPGLADAVRRD